MREKNPNEPVASVKPAESTTEEQIKEAEHQAYIEISQTLKLLQHRQTLQPSSRTVALAITKLQEAQHWLKHKD